MNFLWIDYCESLSEKVMLYSTWDQSFRGKQFINQKIHSISGHSLQKISFREKCKAVFNILDPFNSGLLVSRSNKKITLGKIFLVFFVDKYILLSKREVNNQSSEVSYFEEQLNLMACMCRGRNYEACYEFS